MSFSTAVKVSLNRLLAPVNLRLESLTAERAERQRLLRLREAGNFTVAVFPVPPAMAISDAEAVLAATRKYSDRFLCFTSSSENDVNFTFENDYFSSPDVEILYAMIRELSPKTFLEVGSGNSTKIARQAIVDGKLSTSIVSIDPHPRNDVSRLADVQRLQCVEEIHEEELASLLSPGDILFIDSSHQVATGSDVTFLLLRVLPRLAAGVVVHIHDIFLPFDYPESWIIEHRWPWNEQYLVQGILEFGNSFEVLWAGHYLQRTRVNFAADFPHLESRSAKSLWLKKV